MRGPRTSSIATRSHALPQAFPGLFLAVALPGSSAGGDLAIRDRHVPSLPSMCLLFSVGEPKERGLLPIMEKKIVLIRRWF